ncbi:putative ribonuclease H-like domain-containing protein [Tanacetum coccineum]
MQKTIMKQQYENFAASRSEGLDKIYDRFQKLISQLEIHGEVITQEDANLKLLRSLPSAWNNIALIMRNKADLDELSMEIYDTSSTNEAVNTAHDFGTMKILEQIDNYDRKIDGSQMVGGHAYHKGEEILKEDRKESEFQWQRNYGFDKTKAEEGTSDFTLMAILSSWVHPVHQVQTFDVDDSRHMTGNKFYLSDYQDIDGGFVAFGGSSKGGNVVPSRRGNLVRGLPSKIFENDHTCVACQKGKQHKASCKTKLVSSISQPLQMLHMDLFGPTFVKSLNKKMYCLVVTDDFSRFSWVFFLASKDETSGILKTFITGIENQINHRVKIIRCDNGTEFKNSEMNQFCQMKGIKREFSVARTPQQNGVAERKNRTLIEAARTMLADSLLPTTFWAEAINTACYVQNRVLITKPHSKIPYELLVGRSPNLDFMRPFGCPVTILNTLDHLGKFEGKADEGYLKGQPKLGLWYPRDSPFDLEAFSNSDYAGASLDRKSTTGGCQFLGKRLISWQCKKQTIVANSTTEAEYVAAANCCGQVLWIQNQMLDYGFNFMNTKIHIDNESTICIVKNPVFHSKTKHIEIRHHFIKDSYENKLVQVIKIYTDHNVADLLTKAFDNQKPRKAKRTTKISQSSRPIHLIANETVYKEWEDRMKKAATTASSLEAEQDSGNINRTQSMATLNESFPQGTDSGSGPRVNTLGSGEDIMKLMELMEYCTKLSKFVRKRKERYSELKNRKRGEIVRLKTERELVRIKIDDGNAFWKEIRFNTGVLKLMLLRLKLNVAKLKLMLLGLIY